MGEKNNPFLSRLSAEIQVQRPHLSKRYPFEHRVAQVPSGTMVWMWFLSTGCRWDACTMCDYGKGAPDEEAMVAAVRRGLAMITDPVDVLVVSPSGSMLDEREVPARARRRIFAAMAEIPGAQVIMVETRADSVRPEILDEMRAAFPERTLGIEMGLESANPWVRRFCINKGEELAGFAGAVDLVQERGLFASVNVALGTTFLSPAEAMADAVQAARWAHANGAAQVILFPMHAKPHTLLGELYLMDHYRPPSLWSLVEVLRQLDPEDQARTSLSWYRLEAAVPVYESPTTCERCAPQVFAYLDAFRATAAAEWIERLDRMVCDCKTAWRESLAWPDQPLSERVWGSYERLARRLRLEPSLRQYQEELRRELFDAFVPVVATPPRRMP